MKDDAEQLRKWGLIAELLALTFWVCGLLLVNSQGKFLWPYWVHFVNATFFVLLAIGLKLGALYYRK